MLKLSFCLAFLVVTLLQLPVAHADSPLAANDAALVKKPRAAVAGSPIPVGKAQQQIDVNGKKIDVFTYKPKHYKDGPLLLVFHGMKRNGDFYRDNSVEMADRFGAVIAAPQFDLERFPTRDYQYGGILDKDRNGRTKDDWTFSMVPKIIDAVRANEGKPRMPYYMIGHSAGGQFLVRFAGFLKTDVERIVAVNPGTELFPSTDHRYPYGFGGLPEELRNDAALKQYLSQPLTLYLGTTDVDRTENLDQSERADRQGKTRLERGKNAYKLAEELAKKNGWAFNWKLVEAEGVNHTSKGMFNHKNCERSVRRYASL